MKIKYETKYHFKKTYICKTICTNLKNGTRVASAYCLKECIYFEGNDKIKQEVTCSYDKAGKE